MKYFISVYIPNLSSEIVNQKWFGKNWGKESTKTKAEMHSIHIRRRIMA